MRETKDIVAIDIVRLRAKLSRAEEANNENDTASAKIHLAAVAGLAMNLAELIDKEEPKNVD